MNKFELERYDILTNINTDIGRHRAWIRSCLNENCLEKYTIAILANEALIRYTTTTTTTTTTKRIRSIYNKKID
jgi:hypothetical protein